jgi:hypothetical protein
LRWTTNVGWLRARIGDWWRRPRRATCRRRILRALEAVGLVAITALICLLLAEIGVRIAIHAPLSEWRDFRHERAAATINHLIQYDSLLGWRLKPFLTESNFNTLDYGLRSNGAANAKVAPGGVLAIGSSFTVGSGVSDSETWPAQLQHVNNAGEGGYQADQIILLGEQLLPLIHPQVLVVDLIPGSIIFTGYASAGWPKPYFTLEHGDLVAHNFPVPPRPTPSGAADIRSFFGHSAAINKFMAAFLSNFWFTSDGNQFVTITTDEIGVTCRMLERLKQKADAAEARLILYLQYPGTEIMDGSRAATGGVLFRLQRWAKGKLKPLLLNTPPGAPDWQEAAVLVGQCAREIHIATVDEFAELRTLYEANRDEWRKYYLIENGAPVHKSALGNLDVARRISAAMGDIAGSRPAPAR